MTWQVTGLALTVPRSKLNAIAGSPLLAGRGSRVSLWAGNSPRSANPTANCRLPPIAVFACAVGAAT